jgi:hypothetical protein
MTTEQVRDGLRNLRAERLQSIDAERQAILANPRGYPPPDYCRHGTPQIGGYVNGYRISGRVCGDCWREIYGTEYYRETIC